MLFFGLKNVLNDSKAVLEWDCARQNLRWIDLTAFLALVFVSLPVNGMLLQRVQSYLGFLDVAVADQLEFWRRKLSTINMLAVLADSIGDKLVPLPTGTSFGDNYGLILHFGLNEPKRIYEINFGWSLRADFRIDVYLDERWPWAIVLFYTLNLSSWCYANMRLVKSLLPQCIVGFQYQQQLVLVLIWKLMRTVFHLLVDLPTSWIR